ncbi:PAS domain-containing sensor histidine kinase [Oscillatoriales cyanobacterium USR001]|nr:PAS domain-containing sensor histidine kinase [Oscillatoriales cyanobacterium USR001]
MDSNQVRAQCQGKDFSIKGCVVVDGINMNSCENTIEAYGQAIAECNYVDKKLQETLKELSELKFALDKSAILAIADARGIITYINNKFCELSKYSPEELIGKTHKIINSGYHSQEFFRDFWQTITVGKIWKGTIKNRAKDGSYYWVDTTVIPFLDETGKPYKYLSIRYDITQAKEAEEESRKQAEQLEIALKKLKLTQSQLVQTEKMSSLGQLVAGVAHEINNPVSFIYGNLVHANEYIESLLKLLNLYREKYPNPVAEIQVLAEDSDIDFLTEDLPKMLMSMKMGANRIREIVLSLRNFSRLDESEMKPVDIHEGIDSTLLILQNQLKGKGEVAEIRVMKEYGNLPLVECYPSQLNQVFMNIIANAIDALDKFRVNEFQGIKYQKEKIEVYPLCPIPTIRIQTKVEEGNRVIISIFDNGIGINPEVMQRLFDPFFTTKDVGKGTGLGLSIAYHIVVEKHQGELTCISHFGQGTKFVIAIPILQLGMKIK